MDTTPLRDAYDAFLDAAALVTRSGAVSDGPPSGEWDAAQIVAHVSLISAATIAAASAVASGVLATYDNRTALDPWRIDRVISLAGGSAGLADRIRSQGDALCAHGGPILTEPELDTLLPTLLLSNARSCSTSQCRCGTSSRAWPASSCPGTPSSCSPCCEGTAWSHGRDPCGRS
ncbi:hypothetical protein [Trebonia kvetii]|uniref:hypothetical protein n=1 Tax=Trebonia kvetii TaxID=2480626 RepID=UPI001C9E63AF|nr:hypothetical protein [Trebonia kvetii]